MAPGIELVTTSSHGGIRLSDERWSEVVRELPQFQPFAGPRWLEEDCDVLVAVALWPDLWPRKTLAAVDRMFLAPFLSADTTEGVVKRWTETTGRGRRFRAMCFHAGSDGA